MAGKCERTARVYGNQARRKLDHERNALATYADAAIGMGDEGRAVPALSTIVLSLDVMAMSPCFIRGLHMTRGVA